MSNSNPYHHPKASIDNLKVIQDTVKKAGLRFQITSNPDTKIEKEEENNDAFRR